MAIKKTIIINDGIVKIKKVFLFIQKLPSTVI